MRSRDNNNPNNPMLRSNVFARPVGEAVDAEPMTVRGVVQRTGLLFVVLLLGAGLAWINLDVARPEPFMGWFLGSFVVALVLAIATSFVPRWAAYTGPVYALAEGIVLGSISKFLQSEPALQNVPMQAVGLTLGVFVTMLFLYQTRIIRVTDKLRMVIVASMAAIMLVYLVSIVMSLFGARMPMIHDASPLGIIFSLIVVGVASFSLLLNFDFIERAAQARAPKQMEWYAAFALVVAVAWLYLEILRLLSKLQRR